MWHIYSNHCCNNYSYNRLQVCHNFLPQLAKPGVAANPDQKPALHFPPCALEMTARLSPCDKAFPNELLAPHAVPIRFAVSTMSSLITAKTYLFGFGKNISLINIPFLS